MVSLGRKTVGDSLPAQTGPSFVHDTWSTRSPTPNSPPAVPCAHTRTRLSFGQTHVAREQSVPVATNIQDEAFSPAIANEDHSDIDDREKMNGPVRDGLACLTRDHSYSSASSYGHTSDRSSCPSNRSSTTSIGSVSPAHSRDCKTGQPDLSTTNDARMPLAAANPASDNTSVPIPQMDLPMAKGTALVGETLLPRPLFYGSPVAGARAKSCEKFPTLSYDSNDLDGCRARPSNSAFTKRSRRRSHTPRPRSKSVPRPGVRMEKVVAQANSDLQSRPPMPVAPEWVATLKATCPSDSRPAKAAYEAVAGLPPNAAEKVIFNILRHLDDPSDLVSAARINRGFYATFKRNEPLLAEAVIFNMSPAAYEYQLACLTPTCQWISLQSYTRAKNTIDQLKPALYASSASFLKPEMIARLAEPSTVRRIDDALWRIWTYCTLFRHRAQDRRTFKAQTHWLNGGRGRRCRRDTSRRYCGTGNGRGLSKSELEDVSELWNCLSLTLSGIFHDREVEAGVAGVFDDCELDAEHPEEWYLNEWIQHIVAHGPAVVLSLVATPTFELARNIGLLNWDPPTSMADTKSTFLSAPVTHVYQERLARDATAKAAQHASSARASRRLSRPGADWNQFVATMKKPTSLKSKQPPLRIRTSMRHVPKGSISSFSQYSRSSIQKTPTEYVRRPSLPKEAIPKVAAYRLATIDTIANNEIPGDSENEVCSASTRPCSPPASTSISRSSTIVHALSPTSTASTKMCASLFPAKVSSTPERVATPPAASTWEQQMRNGHRRKSSVVDPVDAAIDLLTKGMGFPLADSKRALARSDTGGCLNVQAAVEMLAVEKRPHRSRKSLELAGTPAPRKQGKKEHCANPACQLKASSSTASTAVAAPAPPLSRQVSKRSSLSQLGRKISRTKAYNVLGMKSDEVNTFEKPTYVPMSMTVPLVPEATEQQQQQQSRRLRKFGNLMGLIEEACVQSALEQRGSTPVTPQASPTHTSSPILSKDPRHTGSPRRGYGAVEGLSSRSSVELSSKEKLPANGSPVFDGERKGSARKVAQMLGIDSTHLAGMGFSEDERKSKLHRLGQARRSNTHPGNLLTVRDCLELPRTGEGDDEDRDGDDGR